jgi:hypothetical protein
VSLTVRVSEQSGFEILPIAFGRRYVQLLSMASVITKEDSMATCKANLRCRLTVLIVLAGMLDMIMAPYSPGEARMPSPSPAAGKAGVVAPSQSKHSSQDKLTSAVANPAAVSNSKSPIGSAKQQCLFSILPSSRDFPSSGGNGSFTVSTRLGCSWSVGVFSSWIFASGSGNGNPSFRPRVSC